MALTVGSDFTLFKNVKTYIFITHLGEEAEHNILLLSFVMLQYSFLNLIWFDGIYIFFIFMK